MVSRFAYVVKGCKEGGSLQTGHTPFERGFPEQSYPLQDRSVKYRNCSWSPRYNYNSVNNQGLRSPNRLTSQKWLGYFHVLAESFFTFLSELIGLRLGESCRFLILLSVRAECHFECLLDRDIDVAGMPHCLYYGRIYRCPQNSVCRFFTTNNNTEGQCCERRNYLFVSSLPFPLSLKAILMWAF